MRLFEAVKVNVTASQAAAYCGFTPNRSKMICCPFHNDKHPSMKVDRRYYCFGCGEHGDAIDFVAKYYDLSLKDAAMKLADDFGIDYDRKIPASIEIKRAQIKQNQDRLQKEQIRDLCKELSELHSFLREKKQQPVTNGNFTILKSYIDDFEYVDYLYEHYILEASNQMRKQEYIWRWENPVETAKRNRKESDRVSETIYAGRYLDRIDSGVAGSYFNSSGLCATDL